MPQYFYHLKFELYPHPDPSNSDTSSTERRTITEEDELEREVWLPRSGNDDEEDIFNSASWPRHKPVVPIVLPKSTSKLDDLDYSRQVSGTTGISSPGSAVGVIDCGPSRAFDKQTVADFNLNTHTSASFPPPNPENIQRCLEVARRDWRFGRVRVESWDLDSGFTHGERIMEGRKRGESSGHAASGMTAGGLTAAGRVTKARFEEGKNTELGWGVVHLYRDGEDSGGRRGGVEIYNSTAVEEEGKEKEGERDEDFTTLCIPAVPSYLTPSDFLGFVGEKTREEVSHFRMVMTGRMNRYLVLMKFRDGGVAKKWKSEWDGKVFNSMEVGSLSYLLGKHRRLIFFFPARNLSCNIHQIHNLPNTHLDLNNQLPRTRPRPLHTLPQTLPTTNSQSRGITNMSRLSRTHGRHDRSPNHPLSTRLPLCLSPKMARFGLSRLSTHQSLPIHLPLFRSSLRSHHRKPLQRVRFLFGPLDLSHLWPRRLWSLQRWPRKRALEGNSPQLRSRDRNTACVGLCRGSVGASSDQRQGKWEGGGVSLVFYFPGEWASGRRGDGDGAEGEIG